MKKPTLKSMRNKADALITPVIKKLYPRSILSGKPTEVAHHFIHKSKSTALRYVIDNLIPLTHAEHLALHHNESYWAGKIIQIKGIKWFNELEKAKNDIVKADLNFYACAYEYFSAMLLQHNI